MSTTVEILADAFKAMGTPFIVGHPGGETVELMEAARVRDMRFLLMKQETAGAMLASTWGEITGSPGVCVSTRGPGAANMVNGVAHAWMDRCPLIAITDQYPGKTHVTGLRQVLDQRQLYAGITKWSSTIYADSVEQQIRRATRVATSPAPGPVHFDLPSTETSREAASLQAPAPLTANVEHPEPSEQSLDGLLKDINNAQRPVILAGLGVLWDRATDPLTRFAEKLGAPVLTTSKCKGAIDERHPLRAGCIIGGIIERTLVEQSDLIITIGLDAIELQPKPWPYDAPVVSIANTPALDALVPASSEIIGNIGSILDVLTSVCADGNGWGHDAAKAFRQNVANALDVSSNGLSPQRAVEITRDVMPDDTVATCDAGASRLLVVQKWQSYGPREFLTSNGLGSMGYAVPGALAARLAWPTRPVVAFTGDGGFMMALAELQTANREKLPITVVVFDDQEVGLIRVKQELKGLPKHGIGIGYTHWESLAAGFGANCTVAETENALADALSACNHTNDTNLIVARIDGSGYVEQFNALREL